MYMDTFVCDIPAPDLLRESNARQVTMHFTVWSQE